MGRLELQLYNTMTREVEPFAPLEPDHVRMYHCGPTVYGYPHVGNLRAYMLADLLRRVMEYAGYRVTQVINITDVGHLTGDDVADAGGEDKLEQEARRLRLTPWDLARHFTWAFFRDLERLRVPSAHYYPRATESVPDMIALIERLIERGHAYASGPNVYFDVASFEGYGRLSGNTLEQLEAGARIEVREDKKSPHDFALWKADPSHIMQWDSPWGRGFPGWHIECSAMSMRFLGESFDIHTGGEDNIFPHHDCEIAQSEGATGKPFARFWLHTRFMTVDGEKMSKSKHNCYTADDVLARGYSARELRYALGRTHYRNALNFTFRGLDDARATLKRLDAFVYKVEREAEGAAQAGPSELAAGALDAFDRALEHDLNVSVALAALHGLVSEGNKRAFDAPEARAVLDALGAMDRVLGVIFWKDTFPAAGPGAGVGSAGSEVVAAAEAPPRPDDAELQALVERRQQARAAKDWSEADRLREVLRGHGFEVEDRPEGPRLVPVRA